ncbi:MAG: hypothetical protein ABIE68_03020 [bacterium]
MNIDLNEAQKVAEEVVGVYNRLYPEKKRNGGYLVISNSNPLVIEDDAPTLLNEKRKKVEGAIGNVRLIVPIGFVPQEKAAKYMTAALEKACRLERRGEDIISSFQGADAKMGRYGGGIRILRAPNHPDSDIIISFSGLCAHGDEVVSLQIAKAIIEEFDVEPYIVISGNCDVYPDINIVLGDF